jgi:thymidylate kinase
MSAPRLVCVTGPDGSGKTTQIGKLAEALTRRGQGPVAAVTIWDLLLDPSAKGMTGFQSPGEVDAYLSLLHPTARALFLYHCFYQALELAYARRPKLCLLNAYWYKYYATEVAHGGDAELLLAPTAVFPEPALTFYLSVSPEESGRRKAGLSGYETGFADPPTPEAFVAFQRKAQVVLEQQAARRGWVRLDGKESVTQVTDLILARMEGE